MRTHRRFRYYHKAFNVARTEKSFLKNVTMERIMTHTKLRSHVEVQNTKCQIHKIVPRCCEKVQFSAFLKRSNAKKGDYNCIIKYF